jgi:hypothetical protein
MKNILLVSFLAVGVFSFAQSYCTPAFGSGCSFGDVIDSFTILTIPKQKLKVHKPTVFVNVFTEPYKTSFMRLLSERKFTEVLKNSNWILAAGYRTTTRKEHIQESIVMVKPRCKRFWIVNLLQKRNYWKLLQRNKKSLLLEVRKILDN